MRLSTRTELKLGQNIQRNTVPGEHRWKRTGFLFSCLHKSSLQTFLQTNLQQQHQKNKLTQHREQSCFAIKFLLFKLLHWSFPKQDTGQHQAKESPEDVKHHGAVQRPDLQSGNIISSKLLTQGETQNLKKSHLPSVESGGPIHLGQILTLPAGRWLQVEQGWSSPAQLQLKQGQRLNTFQQLPSYVKTKTLT